MTITSITRTAIAAVAALTLVACGGDEVTTSAKDKAPAQQGTSEGPMAGAPGSAPKESDSPEPEASAEPTPSTDDADANPDEGKDEGQDKDDDTGSGDKTEDTDSKSKNEDKGSGSKDKGKSNDTDNGDEQGSPGDHPPQKQQVMHGDAKFDFKYFSVETIYPDREPEPIEGLTWNYVRTCLHTLPDDAASVATYASDWRVEYMPSGTKLELVPSGVYTPLYPEKTKLGVGDCVEGYISYKTADEDVDGVALTYTNEYGAQGRWTYD